MIRAFEALPGTVRGPIFMVLGGVSLILLAVVIRHMKAEFHVLEMIFLRSAVSLVLLLPWAMRQGLAGLRTLRPGLHVFRNVIHYLGNVGWFLGVTLIPLADVQALQFTVPLFGIVMAALILRESVGAHRWTAVVVGFIGALIIIRPGLVTIGTGTAAVIVSAFFYALSQTATKMLSRTDRSTAILFYMTIIFVPVSAGPAAMVWVTPGWNDALPIFLLGFLGCMAHFFIIRAFAAADASFITGFDFLRLPVAALFGYVLYREAPDLWVWTGAVVIFAAVWYVARGERRRVAGAPAR